MRSEETPKGQTSDSHEEFPLDEIVKALKSVRYGCVQIIIQDSKVVQIERTEKIRFIRQDSRRLQ